YRPDAAVLGCLNKGDITSLQESSTGGIVGELDWYGQIEFCCCIPDLSHEYNLWEGGVKYDALLYESYRVQNNATYESAEPGHYSQIGTVYWEIPSSVGYPILKNCPFQATLY
ncbi:MAG: hypothetical protein IKY70_03995, partial [Bacteroidales bacterium]|nr:hypothetical protein [Bacteroidales bacterium]